MKLSPKFTVVFDDQGMLLLLIQALEGEVVTYPSSFHIGFIQPTPERVGEMNKQLRDDGFDVDQPSRQHGSWTFYFTAPGGFVIEVLG